ncbi:semaphorin-3F-like isoform X2 [Sphaerodactylus townsendi]|uniref:semaphorin-3F-like isoform X2 n=1 Tax=Sphaerodactylus townsendi TaxID=933632 RepID=UPI0020274AA3|nr:semaphorin-3F-like isoform X2 [Sphaerodactylus townsendi]
MAAGGRGRGGEGPSPSKTGGGAPVGGAMAEGSGTGGGGGLWTRSRRGRVGVGCLGTGAPLWGLPVSAPNFKVPPARGGGAGRAFEVPISRGVRSGYSCLAVCPVGRPGEGAAFDLRDSRAAEPSFQQPLPCSRASGSVHRSPPPTPPPPRAPSAPGVPRYPHPSLLAGVSAAPSAMGSWATRFLLWLPFFCSLVQASLNGAPRLYLTYKELLETQPSSTGCLPACDLRILLVDQDQGRLYLGARDYLVALDLHNINKEPLIIHWPALPTHRNECRLAGKGQWSECFNYIRLMEPLNRTHIYACGTSAYHPVCALINRGWRSEEYLFRMVPRSLEPGKGKCPYDPRQNSMAVLINNTLYAGVHVDFMGTDAALFRTMGPRPAVRTEQHDSRWLYDPVFLHAHVIPDSSDHNDDKLYFFFREKALEGAVGPAVLARVGRVCLNDDGGQRSLVNKWTTFLKARLVCSVVGEDGVETFFDELRDVFLLPTQDEKHPLLYGVFSTLGSVFRGSAVCVYSMADIRTVFNGPFAHKEGHNYQWGPYTGRVPYPRPGACPGGTFTPGLRSTREFSDELVTFVRNHPLMYNSVYPLQRRPLLVRTNVPYSFTTLAVDLVDAVDGRYEVLFLGTDRGTVQKVIVLPQEHGVLEELTLEEVEVFRSPAPVKTLWISSKRQQLYVSSDVGVSQLSLHRCREYGEACADCCLARDPYCAWDGQRCARYSHTAKRRSRRQDIKHGDPLRQCRGFNAKEQQLPEQVQYGLEGGSVFLECEPRSPHASVKWLVQTEGSDKRKVLPRDRVLLRTPQGVLLGPVAPTDGGLYQCIGTENRFRHTLRRVHLHVLPRALLGEAITQQAPSTLGICESYWHQLSGDQDTRRGRSGRQSPWDSEQQANGDRADRHSSNWTRSSPQHSRSGNGRRRHQHHHRPKPWTGHRSPPRS